MGFEQLPLFLLLAALLVLSGLASGSETALFSLTHGERVQLRRLSPRAADAVAAMLARPRLLLVFILLLNMAVNVTYFVGSSVLALRAESALAGAAAGVGSVIAIVLFGEVLAKVGVSAARVPFCRVMAPVLVTFQRTLWPGLVGLDRYAVAPIGRLIRSPASGQADRTLSLEEMAALVSAGASEGVIDTEEQRLLEEVVELGHVRVREVMTPRVNARWVDAGATRDEFLDLVRQTGRGNFPLCRGSLDGEVLGVVSAKRVLALAAAVGGFDLRAQATAPLFVPEQTRLDRLLERFRSTGQHIAVCVDELGVVTGLVEIEDVADELLRGLGEAREGEDDRVTMVGLGRWLVPGRLSVRDWSEFFSPGELDVILGGHRVSTVAGLVMVALGRLPEEGDTVRVGRVRLRVDRMLGRTVERVEVALEDGEGGR